MTTESTKGQEPSFPLVQQAGIPTQPTGQPTISFAPVKTSDEDDKKASAAEQQMLTSVPSATSPSPVTPPANQYVQSSGLMMGVMPYGLVGMLLFMILLYRSFPLVFSLLVSASPVLVCTTVLLGTLLSFGQANIPEIEREEKLTHDSASLRIGVSGDQTVVVRRDGELSTGRSSRKTRDIADESVDASYTGYRVSNEAEDREGSTVCAPLISGNLQQTQNEKRVIEDVERELDSPQFQNKKTFHEDELGMEGIGWDVEAVEQQYTLVHHVEDDVPPQKQAVYVYKGDYLDSSPGGGGADHGVEPLYTLVRQVEDISPRELFYGVKGDYLESSLGGGGGGGDEEVDEDMDDDASDSESDLTESSSPDASMADILPMLDELHPLLDTEALQPKNVSHDDSDDDTSDRSHRGNVSSIASDEEPKNRNRGVQKDEDVDYNDDGDEEEAQGGKEDESKTAIKWTDDDQKNLMDLGNLELERNLRLENLIARRRARKSFKISTEKDLIDFDSADLPFNVAPISTARQNPFDVPYDPFDNISLPPIPGSAPSIYSQRRNPFDLPYDANEEKPDLKGDNFEQEFMTSHFKDAFFRRHERLSLGSSSLRNIKQERQQFKWRPVFLPEKLAFEGTSNSSFQRQLSSISDSNLSSVPDTESVSSAADLDERKFSEQEMTKETKVMFNIYHAHDLVEHGSQFYEDVDSLATEEAVKRDTEHDNLETKLGELQNLKPTLSDSGDVPSVAEHMTNETHLELEPVQEDNSSSSIFSSLLEVGEKISDVGEGGSEAIGVTNEKFVISPQLSVEESEVQFSSRTADENEYKEPVYDSTPLPAEKILLFSSISSDVQVEISEIPGSAEMYVPSVELNSGVHGESMENSTSGRVEISGATSGKYISDEIEKSLATYKQLNLACSHLEEEAKNLDMKTVLLDSTGQSILAENNPPLEQEKVLSWSDKSMVEPCFHDDAEALVINEEVDDNKEIDPGLLSELDAVGDFSIKEVVGEPLHTYEQTAEEGNFVGLKLGDLNLSESIQELPVLETRSIEDIDLAFRQIHKGHDSEEVILPNMYDDHLEVESMQTTLELPFVEARLEDIVSTLKHCPEGNVNELPQLLDRDRSAELSLEYIHTVLKQASEGNNDSELSKPSFSKDGLEEAGTAASGSNVDEPGVHEPVTTLTTLKQVSGSNVDELPKSENLQDGLAKVSTSGTD